MSARAALTVLALTLGTGQAHAVTAQDYLERFNDDQRFAYMNGALDAMTYSLATAGQGAKAECLIDLFFRTPATQDEIAATFAAHPELPAVAILQVLGDRHCN